MIGGCPPSNVISKKSLCTSNIGALQGYNKDTAWKELGLDQELVMQMRRSYDVRPPRMEDDHIHWHGNDRR